MRRQSSLRDAARADSLMKDTAQIIENLMNNLSRGLVFVDSERRISICNQKAREITGIDFDRTNTHEAGQIMPGDIVVIADNALGDDDGDLTVEDLELINIRDRKIRTGDMIIGAGVYKNRKIEPVYKYMRGHQLNTPFELDTRYLGFHINARIDSSDKSIDISVNGKVFAMNFFNAIGHMVVIDGVTGQIKFFQMPGYSIRKEAAGTLMNGGTFFAKKGSNEEDFPVIGKKLLEVFDESELTRKVFELLEGKEAHIKDSLYEINRRPFICSLFPLIDSEDENRIKGVFMMLQDATELEELLDDRNRIIEEIEKQHRVHSSYRKSFPKDAFRKFVGSGPLIQDVKYLAYKASQTRFNVIITGESGTGKSQLAREIHTIANPSAPFVEVNCNAIAPTLFESELFGYVGGAFTGASVSGKAGYFEAADGGTIFLDEIGEIPLDIQVKLLHVLQNKIIYRVGSSKPIKVDLRVIAATNRNLEEEVLRGTFRRDLFYRINVFPIDIPPLRDRKTDLYLLINQIMKRICEQYDMPVKQFSGEALRKMLSYSWPGNVRELENVIERAITLCETSLIYPEHINIAERKIATTMKDLISIEEARIIEEALIRNNSDRKKVMEELDISRSSFYEKCKKYQIPV